MKWKKFTIETTSQAEDLVCGMLTELGVESVEIEDRQHITPAEQEQMHIGFLPELPEDDGKAYISFYIEAGDAAKPDRCLRSGQIGSQDVPEERQTDSLITEDQDQLSGQQLSEEQRFSEEQLSEQQLSKQRLSEQQLFEQQLSEQQLLAQIREELCAMSAYADVGTCVITESFTEDADWINNWKQYFKPFMVDDVLIRPSWYQENETDIGKNAAIVIEMDPGTAFGTGMHESTQLILRQLKKYVTPETKLLDAGCGSGILSILALKLGAAFAAGVDIEEAAVDAAVENMAANGIPEERYKVRLGNMLEDGPGNDLAQWIGFGEYDLVVANILADVVIGLAPVVGKYIKENGLFVTSGILYTQEEHVKQAMLESGFEIIEITRQNDWISLTGRKQ